MAPSLRARLRRLAHPRSRRSQLWACVCYGASRRDGGADGQDPD